MNLYIVTGTTQGLGRALAERIARDPDNELVALSRAADGPIPGGARIEADLADGAALERACDRIEGRIRGKRYDKAVLVNNAGVAAPVAPLEAVDPEALERNILVNLVAPMRLMRRFLRMTEGIAPVRRIVNISSGAGRRPVSGWSAYCAAKAGLDMASRVAALESQSRGRAVEVVSLAPGVIDTGMQGAIRGVSAEDFADVDRFRRMKAEGALRAPADVAEDILRLEAAGRLAGEPLADLRQLAGD
ncbi:MAG TPA: SDR family NAD(P)-dependent oxidoreductase [Usitatibacter sp.]|nr:SDR family NAD(P)-dependent oxidoreductase [Usitatibacter sp.]